MRVQTYIQSEALRDLDCTLMESVIHVHVLRYFTSHRVCVGRLIKSTNQLFNFVPASPQIIIYVFSYFLPWQVHGYVRRWYLLLHTYNVLGIHMRSVFASHVLAIRIHKNRRGLVGQCSKVQVRL